jgi:hypothetical protein
MVIAATILGLIAVFLGLALSAYAIYLTENKGRAGSCSLM